MTLADWVTAPWKYNLSLHTYYYYFIFQVGSVLITSCPDVMMALDLTGVNPTNIPVNFQNCGKISFSSIKFDRQFTGGQLLKFNMESVNSVKMENLDVRDALQVSDFISWILTCFIRLTNLFQF